MSIHSDRRQFLQAIIGGAAGISLSYSAFGQTSPPPIKATKLSEDLAMLTGDGGNIAIIIGNDGLMMIDAGLPDRASDLVKAVADGVDARHQVHLLFNTHCHFDHIGANELLGASGAKIIAHENVKKRLSAPYKSEALGRTFDPLKPEGLPVETFTRGGKMNFGKQQLQYAYFENAHTDGDSYVFFPGPNILQTGDLLFNRMYPVIDYSAKGWIGGMASACDALLKVGDAETRIIPGHGPLGTKEDLKATRDMLVAIQERLQPMAKRGMTVDEVIAAAPTKDFDAQWGKARPADVFLKQAYPSLLQHQNM